jgi:serralysin
MGKVVATRALDLTTLNFASFATGKNLKISSSVISFDHGTSTRDKFTGSFSTNYFNKTISGTASSWTKYNHKTGTVYFQLSDIKLSASSVFAAAKTSKTSDDHSLIVGALAKSDTITGSSYADKLYGYNGNDTIDGGGGPDIIDGGEGVDRVSYANATTPVEIALNGATWVTVKISGLTEDSVRNVEQVVGGSGADVLTGDGLANWLAGGSGNDLINGGAGSDTLSGGYGNDTVSGGSGNDTVSGGSLHDIIAGNSGNDVLDGGSGNDTITGGTGRDTITGGADADTFRYTTIADSPNGATTRDYVTDFVHGVDKFDLSAIDARASVDLDQAFVLDAKGSSSTAVAEGHIGWYRVNPSGTANDRTILRINVDGDSTIEMSIELKGLVWLSASDFIL